MRTSLIIPTRNASSHLARLLPALKMQTLQPDEMLVVDSASSDDTVARFREFGALRGRRGRSAAQWRHRWLRRFF
ncbi:glycosyltransferase family 2 protein [Klebsiella pneumoniae]|uniref:glycosyltransferase family 2 protein n=1 Tax=Klebsiella pneumoniae TaxID=573 RepID=UPI0039C31292